MKYVQSQTKCLKERVKVIALDSKIWKRFPQLCSKCHKLVDFFPTSFRRDEEALESLFKQSGEDTSLVLII